MLVKQNTFVTDKSSHYVHKLDAKAPKSCMIDIFIPSGVGLRIDALM